MVGGGVEVAEELLECAGVVDAACAAGLKDAIDGATTELGDVGRLPFGAGAEHVVGGFAAIGGGGQLVAEVEREELRGPDLGVGLGQAHL